MGTSDIALERVQALLKVDAGNGSIYNHMVQVVRSLAAEKPGDALAQLEALSRQLKDSSFRGAPAPESAEESVAAIAADEEKKQRSLRAFELIRPSDPSAAPRVLCAVQNFMEDAAMFQWAGVGFGKQESFQIAMNLRKLATDVPALDNLRLWGKVMGIDADYYVAEGSLKKPPGAVAPPAPLPGSPEFDVENRGEGANLFTYWVTTGGANPWVRLPTARASQIVAARSIKKMMTGNLESSVESTPWFPGTEQHLLRAQIARITSTCSLAVRDWYVADDEEGALKNAIKMAEEPLAAFPPEEELVTPAGWVHCTPFLLSTGKSTWPNPDDYPEGVLSEEQIAEIGAQAEAEAEHGMLESLEADLEDLKPEDFEGSIAWNFKVYGDEGLYTYPDSQKTHRVTAVRSLIWPGAITVAQGSRFANLYVGYAMKCGSLVPNQKDSGLPLRGTMALMPLAPDDICDEPADLEEQEEPNPIQDEAESDKGDVDEDPDAE
eukprot:TRINITY_DN631_c0_g3_i1.p1 TRINITY_DN631_c0_g3~~TRINITY_DN631_c0_g3_i1.p1  ORF type:complete len:493 (+),score=141.58 TRINITY_DN631_c0_g3_i1:123-1601(+)